MKTVIHRMYRQARRGTLKIVTGYGNNRVFQVFSHNIRKELTCAKVLLRMKHGGGETSVQRLAVNFFQALKEGKFKVVRKNRAVEYYLVRGKIFRMIIQNEHHAEEVLRTLDAK